MHFFGGSPDMKSTPAKAGRQDGFTLIELLAVITIILLLAGLILGLAGNAQYKGALSRAQGEVQAFSTAIGNYQIDNGTYPRDPSTSSVTDTLDARNTTKYSDPAASSSPTYTATSLFLYECLSGGFYYDTTKSPAVLTFYGPAAVGSSVPKPTVYFPFKENQLKYKNTSTGSPQDVAAIVDPFGLSYGYSTAFQANQDQINAGQTGKTPAPGYNPTFDLWSTAGYSDTQGKALPTGISETATDSSNVSKLWVKNW